MSRNLIKLEKWGRKHNYEIILTIPKYI